MPYAFVQVVPGLSAAEYRRVVDALGAGPWPGLLAHLAGPCDAGWRIIQVWVDAESYASFERDHLWGALAASDTYAAATGAPVFEWLDLEHVIVGTPDSSSQRGTDGSSGDAA
jgi:hypothetical protein